MKLSHRDTAIVIVIIKLDVILFRGHFFLSDTALIAIWNEGLKVKVKLAIPKSRSCKTPQPARLAI